jgi:diaminohydroxyphosphoribosylaminopyrimidine deaminase/5-amino-6-(5-phosphoribosylamino)uracil reductase
VSAGEDASWMGEALALADAAVGTTWPNPAVGCVLVRDGRAVGRGATRRGGRPHAEAEALRDAGEAARGATAYVTLEPCAHQRPGGPCADALAVAGVRRVVVALGDPDPRVDGRGLARLRAAGVAVEAGCREAEARALNAGHLKRLARGLPFVALKLAQSLDGRIATASGESRWITGEEARAETHRLRARHDAILVGSGTALADDPLLTCRVPGLEDRSPVRVVLDRRLRLPPTSRLAATAREVPVWVVAGPGADEGRAGALEALGCEVLPCAGDAASALAALAGRGITRALVEGGAAVAASLLRGERLVDRLYLFEAPLLLGAEALPAVGDLGVGRLADARRWRRADGEDRRLGDDRLRVLDAAAG